MKEIEGHWALIMGCSSGFGAATARALAKRGMNIAGVHFDRKSDMDRVEQLIEELEANGVQVEFFNRNAASDRTLSKVMDTMEEEVGDEQSVKVLMHSLAFGSLKKYIGEEDEVVDQKQMDMTLDVMAHTLVYWAQEIIDRGLMKDEGRIFAMTSAGAHTAWPHYGPVSAAKAALEAHIRQLAYELSEEGITANAIQAGVTDTPALRKIPGNDNMIAEAKRRNPSGRLTEPEDVADFISLLVNDGARFVTGNVLRCDGGEDIVS
ncbi:MAG: enoyl-ACP reductase FabI [bacterium]